ncbi:MAG: undecaprenyl-diphosphate phosphatase [Acidimicrobiia bacterium]|nr:undecaprenyl-diphosphate phosphatase [Acidimicrobiia bacterium]
MPIIHAIVLAIVQGLTEFFPVSSSGHLAIVPWLFGWDDFAGNPELEKAFDVALHIGTLTGAVAYFRKDLWRYGTAGLAVLFDGERRRSGDVDARIAWMLVVSVVPGALTGVVLADALDSLDRQFWLIGVLLIVFGLVLAWADRLAGARPATSFGFRDAALLGIGQALALQPGVSRSGVTMSVARWLGFDRDAAVRLSFLMAIPIIAGAGVFSFVDVLGEGGVPADFRPAFAVGMLTAGLTGWAAVWATLRIIRTRTFDSFVIYRVILGLAVLALVASPWR